MFLPRLQSHQSVLTQLSAFESALASLLDRMEDADIRLARIEAQQGGNIIETAPPLPSFATMSPRIAAASNNAVRTSGNGIDAKPALRRRSTLGPDAHLFGDGSASGMLAAMGGPEGGRQYYTARSFSGRMGDRTGSGRPGAEARQERSFTTRLRSAVSGLEGRVSCLFSRRLWFVSRL